MQGKAWMAILLLAPLLGLPGAGANGGGHGSVGHLDVSYGPLAPGQSQFFYLDPEEQRTMTQGWSFLLYGYNQGPAPIDVRLFSGGVMTNRWTWPPGAFHLNTTNLRFSGVHELELRNPSQNRSAGYVLYFDQSCNCLGKQIPLDGGTVLFHYDLPADRDVRVQFPLIKGWKVRATLATLQRDEGRWPHDYQNLSQLTATGPGWLNLSFQTTKAQRYFVFVQALEGARFDLQNPSAIQLTPLLEVRDRSTPGLGALAALASMGSVLAVVEWRRRAA